MPSLPTGHVVQEFVRLEAPEVYRVFCAAGEMFGCVDLLCKPTGEWVVLEVGTDGLFNHVDRDIGDSELEHELNQRVANAFWNAAQRDGRGE